MAEKKLPLGIVILAAGQGKRMHSDLPKVLHSLGGKTLICHILERISEAFSSQSLKPEITVVVGHAREQVQSAIDPIAKALKLPIDFVFQSPQNGTGHALQFVLAQSKHRAWTAKEGVILVLPGDQPLLSQSLIQAASAPLSKGAALRIVSAVVQDPSGYGRVVRAKNGKITSIIEDRDANPIQKEIQEIGTSTYLFQAEIFKKFLPKLKPNNAQKEYYLTDVLPMAIKAGKKIDSLVWKDSNELRGINDLWELALAEQILNRRTLQFWAKRGVRFQNPESISISADVVLSTGVKVGPGVIISGRSKIGTGAEIKAGSVIEDSRVGERSKIGPYAHLRPESDVGADCKIGNFVELKKSSIGSGTSIAHLSYVGDAEVGKGVNIGCGFVTCNFDGRTRNGERKHKTIIEEGAFIGSDCQTVAPVRVGKNAYVASGSTLTEDVPPEALAIARSRQVVKPGWRKR